MCVIRERAVENLSSGCSRLWTVLAINLLDAGDDRRRKQSCRRSSDRKHVGYDLASFHGDPAICFLCEQLVRSGCLLVWQLARRFFPFHADTDCAYSVSSSVIPLSVIYFL
jgi:hypothetical protein